MTASIRIPSFLRCARSSKPHAAWKALVLTFAMALGAAGPAQAQTGPGGVDDTSATNGSDLRIWLRADKNVTTNASDEVTGWDNLVGETAQTAVSGAPTLESGTIGGEPTVRFNEGVSDPGNVTDYLDYDTEDGSLSGTNTIVVVSKNSGELFNIMNQTPIGFGTDYQDRNNPNSKSPDGRGLTYSLDTQTSGDDVALAAVNGDASGAGNDPLSGDVAGDLTYNVTPFHIYSSIANPGGNDQDLLADGEVLEAAGNASGRTKSTARVGERLIGDVAEVVVLNRAVNAAERTILHNYLSTKYGISLDDAVADKYGYDSGHPGDVAGVGQAGSSIGDAASGNKAKAQSSGLFLDVSPPGFTLNDGDYALYGHDNANFSFTAVETPNGRENAQKLAREWRIDLTNKSDLKGATTLGFDESTLPSSERIGNTSSYNDYFLFVDSDGDFSDGNAKGFDLSDPDDDGVYTTNNTAQSVGQEIKDGDYITIARVKRTINFTKAIGSGFENTAGTVSVTARIDFATNQGLNVDATADPLTGDPNLPAATGGGDDFTDNGKTWQFGSNTEDSRDVFTVEDDGSTEDTELLKVTPASLPAGIAQGDTTRFEYSILDEDTPDKAEFASGNPTSVTEGNTTVTFDVEVSNSGSGKAFFKTSGDAVAGEDYEITAATTSDTTKGEVSLSSGTGSFDITILDDNLSEADEDLTIELYAAKNGITLKSGGNLSETLTITDDDGVPSVSFTSDSYSGEEGTDVDVTLELDASAGQDLDAKIQDDTGAGEPVEGSDYEFSSPKTVTIPSGNTQKTFSVTLKGDGTVESTETIDLSIVDDSDTEPNLGTPDATTISILDNSGVGKVGPGGVGNSSSLSLWLRSDEGVTTDGGGVKSWADQSGNGNDATQADDAEKPAFGNTTLNGINVLTFDGNTTQEEGDYLRTPIASLPSSSHTLFSVSSANSAGAAFGVDDGNYNSIRTLEYTDGTTAAASQDGNTTGGVGAGGVSVLASAFDGSNVDIRVDGTVQSTGAGTNANGSFSFVGGEVQNAGTGDQPIPAAENPFDGDLGEIIAYNQTLNRAQRQIVEQYLVSKYGITSSIDTLYAGNLGADGTDGNADDRDADVIGVGQAADGTKHFAAQGGGFALSVAGGANNGDFVLAGRKTVVTERINTTDTSTTNGIGVTARINEDRYIDVTGDGISVDVTFNFADSDIVGPAGDPANYVLLRRGGTSGDWTKVTKGASFSSERVTFTNVSLTDADDGYFTIGTTDNANSPIDTRYITVRGDTGPDNDDGYYHFSAPVDANESATYSDLEKPNGDQVIDFNPPSSLNPFAPELAYEWDGANQTWTAVSSGTSLTTGKGFTLWIDDTNASDRGDSGKNYRIDPEYTFGLANDLSFQTDNRDVSVPYCSSCSDVEFYLLGNPYIQGFNLKGLNLDTGAPDFQQDVFVWNNRKSTYEVKSRTAGDKISRWQSFWVERATQGTGATTLTFDKTGRVSSLVPYVGSKARTDAGTGDWARIALALTAENNGEVVSTDKAAVLFFHDAATEGWDPYDLSKFANSGATLAALGSGRDGSEIPKAQESRSITPDDSFTVDLQLNERDVDGTFEITPHQWERIPSDWDLTLIHTKGTSETDDNERVALEESTTYQFDISSTSTTSNSKAVSTELPVPSAKTVEKSSGMPRFQIRVEPGSEALPVELSSVNAVIEEKDAILEWQTASETNNAGFEVQHKAKGETESDFKMAGFVEGEGTTSEPQSYRFRLEDLAYGSHVFRLRQIDQDGSESLSKEVEAQVRLEEAYNVSAPYPNPFRSRATVDLTVREAQDVQVSLFDVLGRRVKTVHSGTLPAQQTRSLQFSEDQLSSGVYFLRVKGESFSTVRKIVHVE